MRPSVGWPLPPSGVGVAAETTLVGLALLLAHWWGIDLIGQLDIGWAALASALALALPPVALLAALVRSHRAWAVGLVRTVDQVAEHLLQRTSPTGLLALAVAAGTGEEALFRGVLQTAVGERLGPIAAVGLVGALFGAVHSISLGYALVATLMGLYLGAAFALTGNLFIPLIVHAAYDFAALLTSRRRIGARARRDTQPGNGRAGL